MNESTPPSRQQKFVLGALLLVGAVVLLGQLWPEGVPPFARVVNIGFVVAALAYFGGRLSGRV